MQQFFNKKLILLTLGLILAIFFLNLYRNSVRNFFYLISEPIQTKLWRARTKDNSVKLREQVEELLARTAQLYEVQEQNKILREALEIGLQEEFKLILCQVSGKNIADDTLIINKGAKDGVKKDMPVISQQKALVGKVDGVFEDFSIVQLISHKNSSFEGKILGRELQGLVKGKGNFAITFDLIPQYEDVKEGEVIATTALGGIFPSGLLVGVVKSVEKSDIEPFQQIEVQPAFDIKQLDYLFIVTNF